MHNIDLMKICRKKGITNNKYIVIIKDKNPSKNPSYKSVSQLNKNELIQSLYNRSCIIKLQRIIRKRKKKRKFSEISENDIIDICDSRHILFPVNIVIKLQRLFRIKHSSDYICPITLDIVQYPCFGFKPKNSRYYIYYNLIDLANYLITSGNFIDPKTKEPYTSNILKKIDKLLIKNNIYDLHVYKSSKDTKKYKLLKDDEDTVMIIERCIDEIMINIVYCLENNVSEIGDDMLSLGNFLIELRSHDDLSFNSCVDNAIIKLENLDEKEISCNIINVLYNLKFGY